MKDLITDLFMKCVYILQVIGGTPNEYSFGYYLANVLIFVFLQPALILLFLYLWIKEKKKRKE